MATGGGRRLGGLVLLSAAAQVPFSRLAHQSLLSGGGSLPSPFTLAYGAVGLVVAWRKPGNPLGWLLLAVAAFGSVSEAASFYTVADYRLHGGGFPLGWVAVLVQPGWAPSIVLLGLIILLFPDGQLPSRRWRWLVGVYLMLGAVWLTAAFVLSAGQLIAHHIRVDSGGNLLVLGTSSAAPSWWVMMQNLVTVAFVVSSLTSLAAQAVSYRRSSGERRQQLKWLLAGAAGGLGGLLLTFSSAGDHGLVRIVAALAAATGVLALPVCMGVAILRYRLYDIDRLISRTLGYALVTGLLVGVYAGLVLLATRGAGVLLDVGGGGVHAGRGGVVQPGAAAGAAGGGPAVQPGPLRRRPDGGRVRGPAAGRGRPGCGPGRPGRHGAERVAAGRGVGVGQGDSVGHQGHAMTRGYLTSVVPGRLRRPAAGLARPPPSSWPG